MSVTHCDDCGEAFSNSRQCGYIDKDGRYYHSACGDLFGVKAQAAEISRLQSRIEELERALKPFADALEHLESELGTDDDSISLVLVGTEISKSDLRFARSALEASNKGAKP